MAVKTYDLKDTKAPKPSPNFSVKEFACSDGSAIVKIDSNLLALLERMRKRVGKPITIVSGYRTESYNKKCGGAKASQHLLGTAADIKVAGVEPLELCRIAEEELAVMGIAGGVGHYPGRFCHVDTRDARARWQQDRSNGKQYNVSGFSQGLSLGDKGEAVKELQRLLGISVDGVFGKDTCRAVMAWQLAHGDTATGVVDDGMMQKLKR